MVEDFLTSKDPIQGRFRLGFTLCENIYLQEGNMLGIFIDFNAMIAFFVIVIASFSALIIPRSKTNNFSR
ncbi:hypothetical protein CKO36_02635 [Rhabdochromatium marinum]|nr:hypothetical protein [Rhabdochromatium marinum]